MMKRLPIGIQDFPKMIKGNYVYVDKTKYCYTLIQRNQYYFFSRPRRFGKSLLVSTLREIFLGNRELFEGLWIYDQLDWVAHPVIWIDFSKLAYNALGLEAALHDMLDELGEQFGVTLTSKAYSGKFLQLIEGLHQEQQVVILIDEYDKPIIDYIDDLETAEQNRIILRNFYSVVKGSDQHIKFFFMTGISRFSQMSIFSELNNLNDITHHKRFAGMVGYLETELENSFRDYLEMFGDQIQLPQLELITLIREWYNGYSWDGRTFVYNPFSILSLFDKEEFGTYWFSTGLPNFVIQLIKQKRYTIFDLEREDYDWMSLETFDIRNINLATLLLQTGYLTIKSIRSMENTVTLDFPNREIRESFSKHLLAGYIRKDFNQSNALLKDLDFVLKEGQVNSFIELLKRLFANLTYPNIDPSERYFHSIFYLTLKLLGYSIQSEVTTARGRVDAVLITEKWIYVIEFKVGDAQSALSQIKEKEYHHKYLGQGKEIVLLGIGFDLESRNIADFELERIG